MSRKLLNIEVRIYVGEKKYGRAWDNGIRETKIGSCGFEWEKPEKLRGVLIWFFCPHDTRDNKCPIFS